MNLDALKQADVAALLLVDPRQVRNYHRETPPIPSHGEGRGLHYKWSEVLPWRDMRRERAKTEIMEQITGGLVNEKLERALLARAQRERIEIENAKARGEVITLDLYAKAIEDLITPARINLLSLRPKLEVEIGREAAVKVETEIKKILEDLGGEGA
jgi:phage terminase Nu1 subunit (DNA packaging protein)